MNSISMPSKPIHFFDVPEVKTFTTEFKYNFFVSDESIDESGNEAINGNLSTRFLRKGTADTSNLNARTPRYVKLSFGFQDSKKAMFSSRDAKQLSMRSEEILEALNTGKIITEDSAAEERYTSMCLGNDSVDVDLENLMRLTLNRYVAGEASIQDAITEFSKSTNVNSNFISTSMVPPSMNERPQGTNFLPFTSNEKKVRNQVQLNSSYAPMMLRKSVERGLSLFDRSLISNYLISLDEITEEKDLDVTVDENIFDIPMLDQQRLKSPRFVSQAAVVGVIVEKNRIFGNKKYPMPAIVITGHRPNEGYDSQVAYGQTYEYVCRTIAKFRIPATLEDGRTFIQTFLVASKPSQKAVVTLTEDRAPDPPQDVNYYYEFDSKSLYITWSPPVNPQRDVKYYQVFRRQSTEEPFELIANLDFDDSLIRSTPVERIDASITTSFSLMPTFYIDSEFTKSKPYIYALVAVDARQISSPYSTQIMVSFDNQKNKIQKSFVCYAGSPKQYPNWTLKNNFFIDSMKDSNHDKVNIYFNPEAYTLIRGNGEAIPAFYSTTIDPLSKYVFQFMNTDRLLEQKFEVRIDDSNFKEDTANETQVLKEDDDE
jgi:hypothetical protein